VCVVLVFLDAGKEVGGNRAERAVKEKEHHELS